MPDMLTRNAKIRMTAGKTLVFSEFAVIGALGFQSCQWH